METSYGELSGPLWELSNICTGAIVGYAWLIPFWGYNSETFDPRRVLRSV